MTNALLVSFPTAKEIIFAARRAQERELVILDAYTPFPIAELGAEPPESGRIGWMALLGGLLGAGVAYGLEALSAGIAYPFDSGGRPYQSWPVFFLAPFEVGVLLAAIFAFAAFLSLTGLPRLNHPVFEADLVERASRDRFVLALAEPADAEGARRLDECLAGALEVRSVQI
ncbi:MAG: quinol:electron acceptor oxidoreductase subunit ActD [Caulobacteraceae bacterium]